MNRPSLHKFSKEQTAKSGDGKEEKPVLPPYGEDKQNRQVLHGLQTRIVFVQW